jgi:uncharacterized protein (DUF3820 family)
MKIYLTSLEKVRRAVISLCLSSVRLYSGRMRKPKSERLVLKFGKYAGFEVRDVDDNYLQWLLSGQVDRIPKGIIKAAQQEIEMRRQGRTSSGLNT